MEAASSSETSLTFSRLITYIYRTAPLTSRRCILYIYSINIHTEYFKHAAHSPFFSSSKCRLFHNTTFFGSCIIHILYTGVLKFKIKFRRLKVKHLMQGYPMCFGNLPKPLLQTGLWTAVYHNEYYT
jgi:hypothetical protein